ncbi:MAG: PorP/SprF family type IX secretion system membrane protein [Chitinophagales bacterium]
MKLFTRIAVLLFISLQSYAQDIHFSMFYASPLNLNPALSGVNDGTYRAAGIYRNQWRSVSTPFVTYSGSFDIKLLQTKLKNDIFGVGGVFTGDRSGDGKLTMNSGMVSAAFHKGLDKNHQHFLGIGVQLGYTQKSLKWQQLAFPTQFNGQDFDLSQSNGENFSKPNIGYFDMSAGFLHQSTVKDIVGFMTGFTVYHLVAPKESFLGQKVTKAMRFTVHEGIRIKAYKGFYICPNFIYQYQLKNQEINFGSSFEYHMPVAKSELVASIGAWGRVTGSDAAIVTAGLEYYKVRVMAAYDINTSTLKPATNGRGAFELAIIYTGFIKSKGLNYPILVPCPMM